MSLASRLASTTLVMSLVTTLASISAPSFTEQIHAGNAVRSQMSEAAVRSALACPI